MNIFQNTGLTSLEAEKRLHQYGPNRIFKPSEIKFWAIAKEEVTEPIILLLLAVGVIYSFWGKLEDAITIFIIISALVFTEVYNEFRAKKAISSLEKIAAPKTRVLRNGKMEEVETEKVVPGDILILSRGTKIAADSKLIKSTNLQVDESSLTGESLSVDKLKDNEIFAGTAVTYGEGLAQVLKTGAGTKMGEIAADLKTVKPPKTKLQLEMKALAGKLLYLAVAVSIAIPIIGILRGQDLKTMILTGLALSFAVIPEELPMVITMVLGLGSYSLSKKNFLVKRIKATEILGNITVIVTDKTGTITRGVMNPVFFYPLSEKNTLSKIVRSFSSFSPSGLDQSLKDKASSLGIKSGGEIVRERDMDEKNKTIATIVKDLNSYELIVRGAPEEIFSICQNIDQEIKSKLTEETKKGRRIIAVASKNIDNLQINTDFKKLEKDLQFFGLIGFEDSPRSAVKETIAQVSRAGIRTIMVTGDHPQTALYIANEVGIKLPDKKILTGEDITKMSDKDLMEAVKNNSVFARTSPQDKYRLVKALQDNGEVVAVTGDGVNDALALKTADIGLAMGIKGTDVAKEAADVVLADDNYITIAHGIFEGRKLFDNLKKGIKYYLSVKLALVLIFFLPVLLGIPTPFAPIQIIILEMFMDLAASAGYVAEPMEKDIYGEFKSNTQEGVLGKRAVADIFFKSILLLITVLSVYFYSVFNNFGILQSQTLAFSAWIFGHVFLAFVSRSDRQSLFSVGPFSNIIIDLWAIGAVLLLLLGINLPILQKQFNLVYIGQAQIFTILLFAFLMSGLVELKKLVIK